jgi:hypothetical protein
MKRILWVSGTRQKADLRTDRNHKFYLVLIWG